jgi:hypothetical protein
MPGEIVPKSDLPALSRIGILRKSTDSLGDFDSNAAGSRERITLGMIDEQCVVVELVGSDGLAVGLVAPAVDALEQTAKILPAAHLPVASHRGDGNNFEPAAQRELPSICKEGLPRIQGDRPRGSPAGTSETI